MDPHECEPLKLTRAPIFTTRAIQAARDLQKKHPWLQKAIWLATDSADVIKESHRLGREFAFMYQDANRAIYDGGGGTFIEDRLNKLQKGGKLKNPVEEVLLDVWAGSRCSAFVGTFTSSLSRVVYAMMNARTGFIMPSASLDEPLSAFPLLDSSVKKKAPAVASSSVSGLPRHPDA